MKEAYLYEKLDRKRVMCHLCGHGCVIKDGSKGICGVRENHGRGENGIPCQSAGFDLFI